MQFLSSFRVCLIAALVLLCQAVNAQPIAGEAPPETPKAQKSEASPRSSRRRPAAGGRPGRRSTGGAAAKARLAR